MKYINYFLYSIYLLVASLPAVGQGSEAPPVGGWILIQTTGGSSSQSATVRYEPAGTLNNYNISVSSAIAAWRSGDFSDPTSRANARKAWLNWVADSFSPKTPVSIVTEYGSDPLYSKLAYKLVIRSGTLSHVTWMETFTPTGASTPSDYRGRSWDPQPTDTESPIYYINPYDGAPHHFGTTPGKYAVQLLPKISIAVDANRDGGITVPNIDSALVTIPNPDATTEDKPFRFWINDDDDWADTQGNDIPGTLAPGSLQPNYTVNLSTGKGVVDGVRDLVDFFPVYLDLKQLLNAIPARTPGVIYKLKHEEDAVNFVYTNLTRAKAFDYQTKSLTTGFGGTDKEVLDQAPGDATTWHVTATGHELSVAFLNLIQNNDGGVILVEGYKATDKPLVLSIEKDNAVIAEVKLELKIDSVEKMFRHKNLLYTDAAGDHTVAARSDYDGESDGSGPKNWPDSLTNGKNLVFVHGYNVNPQQARGWAAEMFKRFWWSGSKARFHAITWPGSETQLNVIVNRVTPNYHANVMNGFGAAHALADYVTTLSASGEVVTVAHSLGNLVATSAIHDWGAAVSKHIAVDAAMAIESLDAGATKNMPNMAHPLWANYSQHAWCTEWYKLFIGRTPVDHRQELTWRGRLGNALTKTWSFYSSGEEVLDNALDEEPGFDEVVVNGVGRYAWAMQEKLKGRLTSNYALGSRYGGWGMSDTWGWFPLVINSTPGSVFMSNPFFDHGPTELAFLYDPSSTATDYRVPDAFFTSNYNGYNANRLLAQMFPALTYAVGRNFVQAIEDYAQGRQFDLNGATFKPNGWPESRRNNDFPNWHHSDIREVAYFYNYPAFDKILTVGGLK